MFNGKLKIVIMISYKSQFSVISVLCSKELVISMNISINNFTVNFREDIAGKLSPWYVGMVS